MRLNNEQLLAALVAEVQGRPVSRIGAAGSFVEVTEAERDALARECEVVAALETWLEHQQSRYLVGGSTVITVEDVLAKLHTLRQRTT